MRQKLPAAYNRAAFFGIIPILLLVLILSMSRVSAQSTFSYDSSFNNQMNTVILK